MLARLWTYLSSMEWVMVLLAVGMVAFAITLVVLIYTRWGHNSPLQKCISLSLLAHVLLVGYAATVRMVGFDPPQREQYVRIALVDGPVGAAHGAPDGTDPLAGPVDVPHPLLTAPKAIKEPLTAETPKAVVPLTKPQAAKIDGKPQREKPAATEMPKPAVAPSKDQQPAADVLISPWTVSATAEKYLKDFSAMQSTNVEKVTTEVAAASSIPAAPLIPSTPSPPTENNVAQTEITADAAVPNVYKLRLAADRLGVAKAGGGSAETEAAVQAALKWLAANQSADGHWDARLYEAGRETQPDGRSRPNAGADADTGMTGLALLAFQAGGNTHVRGSYRENVRKGLNYLIQSQDREGSLAGSADRYAAMYCHAISTFALSEAYGMTHERTLEQPVRRAIGYTVACQDPYGGGWRYRPHDSGDTSQLGWQFMALKSAALAGIPIPDETRQGIVRYLQSVSTGTSGGLASYRPGEAPSRTMTAEAMLCWQFLGIAREHPANGEAANYLLSSPPGVGQTNFYYWYYGTLVTFQMQGEAWQKWNAALATQLVGTQQKDGEQAGSWDPDPVWGGYGGRIYSTSLGALCLEVYYRFLPVYGKAN